jgi:uncharacterized membrane protein YeaQ/YmgE (transglycosylase-associated protein family)
MEIVVWTLAGALAGVLLNMLLRQKALSAMGTVLTAATAAVIGGYLVAPVLGLTEVGNLDLAGLVVALMCAVVGVSIANQHREDM